MVHCLRRVTPYGSRTVPNPAIRPRIVGRLRSVAATRQDLCRASEPNGALPAASDTLRIVDCFRAGARFARARAPALQLLPCLWPTRAAPEDETLDSWPHGRYRQR